MADRDAGRVLAKQGLLHRDPVAGGRVVFNTSDTVDTHDFARVRVAGLERVLGSSPPRFMVTVPHGYADPDRVEADLIAGGLVCESAETVTLVGTAESAADIAVGFCTGTPGFGPRSRREPTLPTQRLWSRPR